MNWFSVISEGIRIDIKKTPRGYRMTNHSERSGVRIVPALMQVVTARVTAIDEKLTHTERLKYELEILKESSDV